MSKRPETTDDLAPYQRVENLFSLKLPEAALKAGALAAADQVIKALIAVHGADALSVTIEGASRIEVVRPYSDDELAEELKRSQESHDLLRKWEQQREGQS